MEQDGANVKMLTRGDQLVTLMIDIPAEDAALRDFVAAWQDEAERNPRAALGV